MAMANLIMLLHRLLGWVISSENAYNYHTSHSVSITYQKCVIVLVYNAPELRLGCCNLSGDQFVCVALILSLNIYRLCAILFVGFAFMALFVLHVFCRIFIVFVRFVFSFETQRHIADNEFVR